MFPPLFLWSEEGWWGGSSAKVMLFKLVRLSLCFSEVSVSVGVWILCGSFMLWVGCGGELLYSEDCVGYHSSSCFPRKQDFRLALSLSCVGRFFLVSHFRMHLDIKFT